MGGEQSRNVSCYTKKQNLKSIRKAVRKWEKKESKEDVNSYSQNPIIGLSDCGSAQNYIIGLSYPNYSISDILKVLEEQKDENISHPPEYVDASTEEAPPPYTE